MNLNKTWILGLLLACGPAQSAFAGGFQLNEHGAAATGRAGAVIATIDDASAVYHNTAAITDLKGFQLQLGVSTIIPFGRYEGAGFASNNPTGEITDNRLKRNPVYVPHLYATYQISERATVGLGVYNHYGMGLTWKNKESWIGRTVLQKLSLRTFYVTPSVGFKLNKHISFGVALNLVPASLMIQRTLGSTDNGQVLFPADVYGSEGWMKLTASAFGIGGIAAVRFTWEDFKVGLSYKSAVALKFSGDVNFHLPDTVPASVQANFPDGGGKGDLTLPHTFGLGMGWEPGDLSLEAAVQITTWSTYNELRIRFDSGLPSADSVSERDWRVVPMFRFGGAYKLGQGTARAGVGYDVSPAPDATVDPTLPDSSRVLATLGGGYDFGPVQADLSYMALFVLERHVTEADDSRTFAPGYYAGGMIHIIALSLGARL